METGNTETLAMQKLLPVCTETAEYALRLFHAFHQIYIREDAGKEL